MFKPEPSQAGDKGKLIVSLEARTRESAIRVVERFSAMAAMFRIDSRLFVSEGPTLIREIVKSGAQVFLDLKLHDLPATVASAVEAAAKLGVSAISVHTLGGAEMMRAACHSVGDRGLLWMGRPAIVAAINRTSYQGLLSSNSHMISDLDSHIAHLAKVARNCTLDGIVASFRDIQIVREYIDAVDFITICDSGMDDITMEGRRISLNQVIRSGADFVIVGPEVVGGADFVEVSNAPMRS
jgi:orotidine-5'-phosphate decarboxylase